MSAISVEHVSKRYGDIVALDDVSLEIAQGEIFVVLGRNGAGKTTMLEIVEGLRDADDGTVSVLGEAPTSAGVRARIGVMPQRGDLYAGIKTREALRLFASFYDDAREPDELLQQLDLERVASSTYRRLSGGEKRRLSLALAVIGRPDIAFLDEPTAEMDVEGREAAWDFVRELRDGGSTVVLVTHELNQVELVADRVGVLHEGRLVAVDTPKKLTTATRSEITMTTSVAVDVDTLAAFLEMKIKELEPLTYRLSGAQPDPHIVSRLTTHLAARGVLIRTMRVGGRSLEEVYKELVA